MVLKVTTVLKYVSDFEQTHFFVYEKINFVETLLKPAAKHTEFTPKILGQLQEVPGLKGW